MRGFEGRTSGLLKGSMWRLILSGAALQRCGNRSCLNAAFATEVRISKGRPVFPRHNKTLLAVTLLVLFFSTYTLAESGADIYKTKCAACHGSNGAADTMLGRNLKLRSLASDDVQKQSDDELAIVISKGKDKMPPFGRKLSKEQIADVVKYIRSLKK